MKLEPPDFDDQEETLDETSEAAPAVLAAKNKDGEEPTTDTEAHLKKKMTAAPRDKMAKLLPMTLKSPQRKYR